MNKRMLVNAAQAGEVRVAVVENNILEDLNVAIEGNKQIKGNIYKAKVVSTPPTKADKYMLFFDGEASGQVRPIDSCYVFPWIG